jgi:hypothetical protein
LIVKSTVETLVHEKELRCSREFLDELNAKVHRIVNESMDRARSNDRLTLKAFDIG